MQTPKEQVMEKQKHKWLILETICQHPRIFLVLSLLFAAFFTAFAPAVKTLENVDFFFLKDHPEVKFYHAFKEVFGNDEFFVIAFEKEDIFTRKNLTLLKNITEELEKLVGIKDIKSLANVDDTIGSPDYFEVRRFLDAIPDGSKELTKLKDRAINNPLYVKNLISPDAKTAAIVVFTQDKPDDENYRKNLIAKVKTILNPYEKEIGKFYLAGWTVTNLSLGEYIIKDVKIFVPITYTVLLLIMWLTYRNIRLLVVSMIVILFTIVTTIGLMGLTGVTLNMVTSILIPLVVTLTICDLDHILSHLDKKVLKETPDKAKALALVLGKIIKPCFLTSLANAIGFLSLLFSEIKPIREFAWIASGGMIFEFIFSFFLLPPLLLFFTPEKIYLEYESKKGMTRFLERINDFLQGHHRLILVGCCAVFLFALWFIGDIRVETNPTEFFKENSNIRNSLSFVEKNLGGIATLDVSIKADVEDAFKEPSNLKVIEKIQNHVKTLKGVDVTTSSVDFIKDMNKSFHDENPDYYRIPETKKLISQYLLLYDSNDIEDFINSTYDHARIAIRSSENGTIEQKRIISGINQFIKSFDHPGLNIQVTGWAIQNVVTVDKMVDLQVNSFSAATITIGIIMFIALWSFTLGALSLIPNLFPVILNFGIMGAFGIPLNTSTALIAAIALGVSVDDTVHFLSAYKAIRAENIPVPDAVKFTILTKGRAMLSSALILSIGFGVLILSNFVPTIQFGMLSAIIMFLALIGDMLLVPSLLLMKKKPGR